METQHFTRPCAVLIKKPKLRVLDEYMAFKGFVLTSAQVPTYDEWVVYKQKLISIERDRLHKVLGKVIIETALDPDNFYIAENNADGAAPTNNRILSVSVSQSVNTAWTANVVLDNTDDKYYLTDTITQDTRIYFQDKECIIESNDTIQIFLPDWNDQISSVFTGFINKISVTDDAEIKRITLQCEDVTKLMATSRTSQNPSLDVVEAEGAHIGIFNPLYAAKPPAEILKYLFGRTFCNIFRDPALIQDLRSTLATLQTSRYAPTRVLAQHRASALQQFNELVDKAVDRYTDSIIDTNGKIVGYKGYRVEPILQDTSVANPSLDLFGKNSPLFTVNPQVLPSIGNTSPNVYQFGRGKLAFEISGLHQPIYTLQFNASYNFINSDWTPNDVLVKSIADKCFFDFYADELGIVHFKPKALVLPEISSHSTKEHQDYIQDNYWITGSSSSKNKKPRNFFVKNWNLNFNDRAIATGVFVQGQFLIGDTLETMGKVVNSPLKFRRKFGIRMLGQESRLGLLTIEAIAAYGQQRLWRQNAQAYAAGLDLIGNGKLRCGNPIYIERWSSVYYIEEVTHTYTAMADYSTEVALLYRRKPIALVGEPFGTVKEQLSRMVAEYDLSQEESDYIIKEQESLTWGKFQDKTLAAQPMDIVWEAIPTILKHSDILVGEESLRKYLISQESADKATLITVTKTTNSAIQNTIREQSTYVMSQPLKDFGLSGKYVAADWKSKAPQKQIGIPQIINQDNTTIK